jgi:hypothetical protein
VIDGADIERLTRVPLREVWKHEAYDFSSWLAENLDVLNEHLEVPLVSADTEQAAGAFSVDLLAEDEGGKSVIIENQLERSNHDHLGKVITYLASYGAETAIWIVADPRPEHVAAITWLNESSPASFYLFKVEAIRIGESAPAPLLTRIVGPSAETQAIGVTKKERSERASIRRRFWTGLLDHARTRNKLHSGRSATDGPYVGGPSGVRGLGLNYGVGQHKTSVILWIDRGAGRGGAENTVAFSMLFAHRAEIEAAFGHELEWQGGSLDVRSCKLLYNIDHGGWRDEEKWPEIYSETVGDMERFAAAIHPYLGEVSDRLKVTAAISGEDEDEDEDESELSEDELASG